MASSSARAQLVKKARALVSRQRDWVANCANVCALLYHTLGHELVNWVGVYAMRPLPLSDAKQQNDTAEHSNNVLVLGPFHGQPAVVKIAIGDGVCGTAVATRAVQVVPDVHALENHIACDAVTESELVVPLFDADGACVGVLDIDSPVKGTFADAKDWQDVLEVARVLAAACNWTNMSAECDADLAAQAAVCIH